MIRGRVILSLANGHPLARPPLILILARRVQTQPTHTPSPKSPVPDPPNKKPRVQFHPAPIKPLKAPPSLPTNVPTPSPTVQNVEPVSLKSLKEATVRDIADAETHGILEPPPPDAGWARSTLHKVIQLGKFYFRGVKLVYTRSKISRDITRRVKGGGAPLERWEHRMLRTQSADVKKLVPFVLIALILEEIIPLIVLWAPGILPSTCILPSQRQRIHEKATENALALVAKHGSALEAMTRAATGGQISLNTISTAEAPKVLCGILRLSTTGFNPLLFRRIRKHLTFIEEDDALLIKEGVQDLSTQDVLQALNERGLITADADTAQQLKLLKWWLKSVQETDDPIARRVYLVSVLGAKQAVA
ncbi:hypothetical protein FB45DRAFT_782268 [Roridomyces roridus]|uniref:Letm1 RBD domain-containing protein n=1 Tax=Roridomyces roridus TaxID=1738132 RepID=A0AAD7FWZ3_9AGAR|nr:hypothetical protein FB45DRAFT_782268 [Roridomyces roridus]